jgi:hypothetical protein
MGDRTPRTAGCGWWAGVVLVSAVLWGREGTAQSVPGAAAVGRLRPADTKAAALLEAGIARSDTFRSLVKALEGSDLVIHVETGVLALPGQVQFVAATPGARYLRVSLRIPGLEDELLPWLAHELWHATEMAAAPEVRSQEALRAFYDKVGGSLRAGSNVIVETAGAQRTQVQVEREIRLNSRRASSKR